MLDISILANRGPIVGKGIPSYAHGFSPLREKNCRAQRDRYRDYKQLKLDPFPPVPDIRKLSPKVFSIAHSDRY